MLIARQKIRYSVVLNENFLTQVATRLAPQNDYVLLRIGITQYKVNKHEKADVGLNLNIGFFVLINFLLCYTNPQ